MNTSLHIHAILDSHLFNPVRTSPLASAANRRRVEFTDMCVSQLPPASKLRYIQHAADCSTPNRLAANERLEQEGFCSFRMLQHILRAEFPTLWPHDKSLGTSKA
jgi:hypothetical protein